MPKSRSVDARKPPRSSIMERRTLGSIVLTGPSIEKEAAAARYIGSSNSPIEPV